MQIEAVMSLSRSRWLPQANSERTFDMQLQLDRFWDEDEKAENPDEPAVDELEASEDDEKLGDASNLWN